MYVYIVIDVSYDDVQPEDIVWKVFANYDAAVEYTKENGAFLKVITEKVEE